jgi:hypothetical protein
VQSEQRVTACTKDVNLFGCFAETPTLFAEGSTVRLRIVWSGASVVGLGRVAYARPGSGMGIEFLTIEPSSLPVLERWLASLTK